MKTSQIIRDKINLSDNLSFKGYLLNKLINERASHPSLYTGKGTCRKWSIKLAFDYMNK